MGHPLAMKWGYVLEHRFVLYESIGPGSHPCHWCKATVSWGAPGTGNRSKGVLVVDHMDGDKLNNDIGNLVPSCNGCNISRSNARRRGHRLSLQS